MAFRSDAVRTCHIQWVVPPEVPFVFVRKTFAVVVQVCNQYVQVMSSSSSQLAEFLRPLKGFSRELIQSLAGAGTFAAKLELRHSSGVQGRWGDRVTPQTRRVSKCTWHDMEVRSAQEQWTPSSADVLMQHLDAQKDRFGDFIRIIQLQRFTWMLNVRTARVQGYSTFERWVEGAFWTEIGLLSALFASDKSRRDHKNALSAC